MIEKRHPVENVNRAVAEQLCFRSRLHLGGHAPFGACPPGIAKLLILLYISWHALNGA